MSTTELFDATKKRKTQRPATFGLSWRPCCRVVQISPKTPFALQVRKYIQHKHLQHFGEIDLGKSGLPTLTNGEKSANV
jgi:hypothetical protein